MLRRSAKVLAAALGLLLAGCASDPGSAGPGATRGAVPDLRGRTVLVFPIQLRASIPSDVTADEEIVFALRARSERVSWVFGSEVEELLRRSPNVQGNLYNLPVGFFLQVEVKRIGDPLYGDIRRLTTLAGANVAVIPIQLRYDPDGAYHLLMTIIDPVTGRVVWFSTVHGEVGPEGSPGALASVADALARALVPVI
jgi:hypothetical protein